MKRVSDAMDEEYARSERLLAEAQRLSAKLAEVEARYEAELARIRHENEMLRHHLSPPLDGSKCGHGCLHLGAK
jgi:F0F1-type ATP synthase membrane subunit b/b'